MMPTFVRGNNPHFPMKKILLITWKILLAILGGFEALRKEKAQRRKEFGLQPIEDTLEVAGRLKPTRISGEGEAAVRNCKRTFKRGYVFSWRSSAADESASAVI